MVLLLPYTGEKAAVTLRVTAIELGLVCAMDDEVLYIDHPSLCLCTSPSGVERG